ncbi:glycosyltransferase family 2 protein [Thermithiobacillus tepidarius DSM 3134]|uniref:glycosyltransferase family 2 protein n=1 Tax=Thermithiobacillus tepidarius TaxID=929 RepID=UPI0009DB8FE8|nr:glycosyltransferase family 2 protein [Thermithiobacillus tepidarius]
MQVKISVCIPSYNRAKFLRPLLDSVLAQDYDPYEIIICEDLSPEREEIREVVNEYLRKLPNKLFYFENEENLGYDANLRNLISKSSGDYCFFMGNDDLMCKGALSTVASAVERHGDVGVFLRAYSWFDRIPEEINQTVRYFPDERIFQPGSETVATFFRRVGVISGFVVNRQAATRYATNQFDGTLYYQMHLTGNILLDMRGVHLPQTLVLCRNSEPPDFGNSSKEKGKYTPGRYTPEARLNMIRGMLLIARNLEDVRKTSVYKKIVQDIGNYFYPYVRDQADLPLGIYLKYCFSLARLGFWRNPMFYIYCAMVLSLGSGRIDAVTRFVRCRLGHSPRIGRVYGGIASLPESLDKSSEHL